MSENHIVKVDGVDRFQCGTLRNAATVYEHLTAKLADAKVELVTPTGETMANPSRHEALAFLIEKGYAVNTDAAAEPEKPAPVRKVTTRATAKPAPAKAPTARKSTTRTTTTTGGTRKRVAAAARK